MTEAETILKMIETVDPADTAKLDEIDARIADYLRPHPDLAWTDYLELNHGGCLSQNTPDPATRSKRLGRGVVFLEQRHYRRGF